MSCKVNSAGRWAVGTLCYEAAMSLGLAFPWILGCPSIAWTLQFCHARISEKRQRCGLKGIGTKGERQEAARPLVEEAEGIEHMIPDDRK